jgi:transcription termination/antitermination protein NusA
MQPNVLAAIRQIASERGLDIEQVMNLIKTAIRQVYKGPEDMGSALEVEFDEDTGAIEVYADKKVVDEVTTPTTQIGLKEAQKIEPRLKLGDHVLVEVTPSGDFGRVAAQAVRQAISQMLRDAERESIFAEIEGKLNTVDTAVVQRVDREGNVFLEVQRAVAKMPPEEQIKGEFYKIPSRIKVFLKKIQIDAKGKILIVSRADKEFLSALFEVEVPEIASGTVEIMDIAREAGSRAKVAVKSNSTGVDPIGACIGQRGARINAITNELKTTRGEEKIDVIPWHEETTTYISNSIRPAEAVEVKIVNAFEHQALILVNDDALSLAIGKEGQNVRLAAKLTGWKLDIQGVRMYEENGRKSKFEMEGGVAGNRAEPKAKPAPVVSESSEPVENVAVEEEPKAKKAVKKVAKVAETEAEPKAKKAIKAKAEPKVAKATKAKAEPKAAKTSKKAKE